MKKVNHDKIRYAQYRADPNKTGAECAKLVRPHLRDSSAKSLASEWDRDDLVINEIQAVKNQAVRESSYGINDHVNLNLKILALRDEDMFYQEGDEVPAGCDIGDPKPNEFWEITATQGKDGTYRRTYKGPSKQRALVALADALGLKGDPSMNQQVQKVIEIPAIPVDNKEEDEFDSWSDSLRVQQTESLGKSHEITIDAEEV